MTALSSILCVDDSPAVGEAVQCLVESEPDLQWAGYLESADELVTEALARRPGIILLDLDMPGRPAFDALSELTDRAPAVRVIILSGFMSDGLLDKALDAGAWGYVNKNDGPQAIMDAIRMVQQNQCPLSLAPDPGPGVPIRRRRIERREEKAERRALRDSR